ncbi:unnamed protein product [Ectocarpus sp. 4 AP-2014]
MNARRVSFFETTTFDFVRKKEKLCRCPVRVCVLLEYAIWAREGGWMEGGWLLFQSCSIDGRFSRRSRQREAVAAAAAAAAVGAVWGNLWYFFIVHTRLFFCLMTLDHAICTVISTCALQASGRSIRPTPLYLSAFITCGRLAIEHVSSSCFGFTMATTPLLTHRITPWYTFLVGEGMPSYCYY